MTTVSFRMDQIVKQKLDFIAATQKRDRSFLINQAIDSYLSLYDWQVAHIKEGLRQAEAGEYASDEEVKAAFARWRK